MCNCTYTYIWCPVSVAAWLLCNCTYTCIWCPVFSRGLTVGQISGPDYCLRRGHRRDGERVQNCTGSRCNLVQIEKFNFHVQQRGRGMAECNQVRPEYWWSTCTCRRLPVIDSPDINYNTLTICRSLTSIYVGGWGT